MRIRLSLAVIAASILLGCCSSAAFASSTDNGEMPQEELSVTSAELSNLTNIVFESGNISSITGKNSDANQNPVRSVDYFRLDSFLSAKADSPYYVRFFAYDKDYMFLRTCSGMQEISHDMILEAAPECVYLRLLLSNRQGEALDPTDPGRYGFAFLGKSSGEDADSTVLTLADLESYADDGAFKQTFSVYLDQAENNCAQVISCTAQYLTTGDAIPTIQLRLVNPDDASIYYSPVYRIGAENEFETKEWRVPPFQADYNRLKITVSIPEEVTLYIQDISNREDADIQQDNGEIIYHAHQGFSGLCPPSTTYAFEMAGEMGYQSCITIPKFTKDGIGVCFHDDSTIRKKLRYADGSVIPEGSEDDAPISAFTYEELMQFDAGRRKSKIYTGMKVPTLEEFFAICARYDMAPVLSVHSTSMFKGSEGKANFAVIRSLAEQYGVLGKLRIKSGSSTVQTAARSIFGKDIGGYILIQGQNSMWDPLNVAKKCGFVADDAESIAESDYWVVMEYFYAAATDEKIMLARNEGFPVSIATTDSGISGPEQERLMGLGVTEFTIDHHCSMGLNW